MDRYEWYITYLYLNLNTFAELEIDKARDDYGIMYEILNAW